MGDQNLALAMARGHIDQLKKDLPAVDIVKSTVGEPMPRMTFFNVDHKNLGWMPIPTSAMEAHVVLYAVESGNYIMDNKDAFLKFYAAMLHDFSKGMTPVMRRT